MIYSGDEIGQTNDWDYKLDPNKVQDSRYLHRGKMPWHLTEKLADEESQEAKIFHGLSALEQLRKTHRGFSAQADFWTWDAGSDEVLGLGRYWDGELLLGIFHFGNEEVAVNLPEGVFADLLTGEAVTGAVAVGTGDFRWLLKK